MLTNRQVYRSFEACKKIYGSNEIHVQFIAIQLGVLAKDVIEYIEANSNLVTTRVSNVPIGINYSGVLVSAVTQLPYLTCDSIVKSGDVDAVIEVALTGGVYDNHDSADDFEVDFGTTGLTIDDVTSTQITFSGTAKAGTISIKLLAVAMEEEIDSDILYFVIPEAELDYAAIKAVLDV